KIYGDMYLDDPGSDFLDRLVPDPGPEQAGQAVFTLGAAIHHALCAGTGATQFFNAVAELARGAGRISIEPVWDRAGLLGPRDPPRVEGGVVREYLGLEKGLNRTVVGEAVIECFHVKDEWVDRFKKMLVQGSGSSYTTFEALGAFIWRNKQINCYVIIPYFSFNGPYQLHAGLKPSRVPGDEMVKFAYSINIRKLVKPPLPTGYWGNGCVPMYAQVSAKELMEQPIWKTAQLIKQSKGNARD
ncbi:hypothetical protein Tsubulata_032427, partial [Turnera subulata]